MVDAVLGRDPFLRVVFEHGLEQFAALGAEAGGQDGGPELGVPVGEAGLVVGQFGHAGPVLKTKINIVPGLSMQNKS